MTTLVQDWLVPFLYSDPDHEKPMSKYSMASGIDNLRNRQIRPQIYLNTPFSPKNPTDKKMAGSLPRLLG